MSILIKRASPEKRAQFFQKNKWVIAKLLGTSTAEPAEEKPKRKKKSEAKAKPKAKAKAKAKPKTKSKAKPKETPIVEEKKAPEVVEEPIENIVETTPVEEEVPSIIQEEAPSTPDDLTQIKGLGPKMVESLTAEGITTFKQLADLTPEGIAKLGETIKGFASVYDRKEFKKQALSLA